MIDLRRLQVLRAVAYYGTVTAAARAMHFTPSAASQQIRQLGRDLGVVLLEPHGRGVRLTAAAHNLLAHADAIEARWREAEAELRGTSDRLAGLLRISGFPTAMATLLAPLAATLRREHPGLTVQLREADPAVCFDLLFNGETDLAVVEAVPESPAAVDRRFDQRPMVDDPLDLLVANDHRFVGRRRVTLADAAGEPWITGWPGTACRQEVLAACSSAGFSPSIAHEAQEWPVVAAMVAQDFGVALVPHMARFPPELPVTRIPLSGRPSPCRQLLTCTRRGSRGDLAIAAALRELDAQVASS
ncbi:MAG: LysR family transcriptional regulator [Propionibacteriales bacterium]|nr:LysR family transcriptional regulator [Propionibacteriales bacterium]